MRRFQGTFETYKRSFLTVFSIFMTIPGTENDFSDFLTVFTQTLSM